MDRTDCFEVKPNPHGEKATYSRFAFDAGELVYVVQGEATGRRSRDSIEVAPDQHVEDAYALFVNHSFTPNLELRGREMMAREGIAPGDELTFNYLENESAIAAPFVCHDTGRAVGAAREHQS